MKNRQKEKYVYTVSEQKLFRRLDSPSKIQDFLNSLKFNFEKKGETCYSPRQVIKFKTAHCMEGALFAAAALEFHGARPLVVDLRSIKPGDDDHVIAVFKMFGSYGAISKTNHSVLRYREPVYKTLRELVMSYFHEYFLNTGQKTLREYSGLVDLRFFDTNPLTLFPSPARGEGGQKIDWRTSEDNLFAIPQKLDKVKHYKILNNQQVKNLRPAERIEIQAGKIIEYKKK
jgi:hypothetical protein